MARIKFGSKRIKNPFRKPAHHGGILLEDTDDNDDNSTVQSSTASSLSSNVGNHGPVDAGTSSRKANNKRSKGRRSPSVRRRSSKKLLSSSNNNGGGLPKIAESPSSRSSTPSQQADGDRAPAPSTPSDQYFVGGISINGGGGDRISPLPDTPFTLTAPGEEEGDECCCYDDYSPSRSPGARSASTVDGRDVFERGRSNASSVVRGGAPGMSNSRRSPVESIDGIKVVVVGGGNNDNDAFDGSPGAESLSTVDGRDVFERGRSGVTAFGGGSVGGGTGTGRSSGRKKRIDGESKSLPSSSNNNNNNNRKQQHGHDSKSLKSIHTTSTKASSPLATLFGFGSSAAAAAATTPAAAVAAAASAGLAITKAVERSPSSHDNGARHGHGEDYHTSLANSRSISPSILDRVHGKKPTEPPTTPDKYSSFEDSKSSEGGSMNNANATTTTPAKQQRESSASSEVSPTSVVMHMFDQALKYSPQIKPVESYTEQENGNHDRYLEACTVDDKYAPPQCQDDDADAAAAAIADAVLDRLSSPQAPPAMPGKKFSRPPTPSARRTKELKKKSFSSQDPPVETAAASTSGSRAWDPLNYSNLEEAVAAHAAMLTDNKKAVKAADKVAGKAVDRAAARAAAKAAARASPVTKVDATSVTSRASTASIRTEEFPDIGAVNKPNPEFMNKKKNAEKNEFKKLVVLKKGESVPAKDVTKIFSRTTPGGAEPQEVIEVQALNTYAAVNQEGAPKRSGTTNGGAGQQQKKRQQQDPEGRMGQEKHMLDPPGVDATNTRSASPLLDSSPGSIATEQGGSRPQTPPSPASSSSPAPAPPLMPAVDVIQSFSYDQDFGVQYTHSDDSCSYLSDMESIGDITICEETERLLNAHKMYTADAKTNVNHPSRRKKSVMRVGSRFRKNRKKNRKTGSVGCCGSASLSSSSNGRIVPTNETLGSSRDTELTMEKKNLTWYDDEENWNKPFMLRTDESFDGSTMSDRDHLGMGGIKGVLPNVERIVRSKVVDQFFGTIINGIGKYASCGGEDDVASFDPAGEQEI